MDLSAELSSRVDQLRPVAGVEGILAALRHIEVAERYLRRGRDERDDDAFNDVIYRSNQAFEGMLKEAYSILTGEDGRKLSTFDIEKHFTVDGKLAARVASLFRNYRQEWRNPATHDHTLLFTEQEGLLAIVNVSAFAAVLLDQIIEHVNFKKEQEELQEKRQRATKLPDKFEELPLADQVVALLQRFVKLLPHDEPRGVVSEVAVLGQLGGFLSTMAPSLKVAREPLVGERYRPDLLLSRGDEAVVVELKRGTSPRVRDAAVAQMFAYLKSAGLRRGVVVIVPPGGGQELAVSTTLSLAGHVTLLAPADKDKPRSTRSTEGRPTQGCS